MTVLARPVRTPSLLVVVLLGVGACGGSSDGTTGPSTNPGGGGGGGGGPTTKVNPCSVASTLQLSSAQTARVDCSNGGTTVTLAGNGVSYLVVPQFAVDLVNDLPQSYRLATATAAASDVGGSFSRMPSLGSSSSAALAAAGTLPPVRPRARQLWFDRSLRARAKQQVQAGFLKPSFARTRTNAAASANVVPAPPAVGSTRNFRVLSSATGSSFATVTAQLAFAGNSLLLYVDTASPPGFTATQLNNFGVLFDQTLYPIDTGAFGPPSDVDGNGRVIMLMTPIVNALTPKNICATEGVIAGFFEEEDLAATAGDPNSNHGEIFYSMVPDSTAKFSCAQTVADVDFSVPATFMHELQHLISFSQHFVVHGGNPEFGWLDEGNSIVAEELGSLYYEQKCPPPACRTSPTQIFPDSSQGFIADFLYDSYQYALRPDTASVTLHSDSDDGFSWRGGDWLLMHWLGDQFGQGIYKKLDQSTSTGVANIQSSAGVPFGQLFADFGLSLYTDSLPGLPRNTAPQADRFTTRNVRLLWNRLFVTSGGSSDVPRSYPIRVSSITGDTTLSTMHPGTMAFYRLDTPASSATVLLQFSGAGGTPLPALLKPQLAIFRLPSGQ